MIRIILIDDHALVRRAFRALLTDVKGIQVIGEAGTGMEGVQLARKLEPNVVILDIKLPDISGLEVTRRLLHLNAPPNVLVVSSATYTEFPQRVLEAGALGYITKEASRAELINAIEAIHKGHAVISPEIATRLALDKIDLKTNTIFSVLTDKEMEIMMLSLRNVPVDAIAGRLLMSPKTVHGYRSRIFKKLNVENEVSLMLLVIREGLMAVEEISR